MAETEGGGGVVVVVGEDDEGKGGGDKEEVGGGDEEVLSVAMATTPHYSPSTIGETMWFGNNLHTLPIRAHPTPTYR